MRYIYVLLRDGPQEAATDRGGGTGPATGRGGGRTVPMTPEPSMLALFWAGVIAASILVYVILDGFDLGVGILFGVTRNPAMRGRMMASIAPFWDGNETWLVVVGASLFAAFPAVYAVFLGAFYLPVLLMLVGLIFRGVAFEFRENSDRFRPLWETGFWIGSLVVAFVQGAAVGALMRGIPVEDVQFAGGALDWLHPFAVLTGIGLVFGYALLGAAWLVLKSDGALHAWARARIPWLVGGTAICLALAAIVSLSIDAGAIAQGQLLDRRWGLVFPLLAIVALVGILATRARASTPSPSADDRLLSRILPDARRDDVALHGPLCPDRRGCGIAGGVPAVLLLGRRRRVAGDRCLYDRRLLGVPRQDRRRRLLTPDRQVLIR